MVCLVGSIYNRVSESSSFLKKRAPMGGASSKYQSQGTELPQVIEGKKSVFEYLVEHLTADDVLDVEASYKVFLKFAKEEGHEKTVELWKYADGFPKLLKKLTGKDEELQASLSEMVSTFFSDDDVKQKVPGPVLVAAIKVVDDHKTGTPPSGNFLDKIKEILRKCINENEIPHFAMSKHITMYINRFVQLQSLVDNDHAMLAFETFLANEYSSENVDFYEAVNRYRMKWDPKDEKMNLLLAEYIVQMYISETAPLQVNINSNIRSRIERHVIKNVTGEVDIFDIAQKGVYELMRLDSWNRFKRSPFWKDLLKSFPPVNPDGSELEIEDSYHLRSARFFLYIGDDSIHTILSTSVGRDYVSKYLRMWKKKDGSVEFLHAVDEFKKMEGDEMVILTASQKLFRKYLDVTSKYEIEIPRNIVKKIESDIELYGDKKAFDKATAAVHKNLVHLNTLRKFKETGLYTKYRLMTRH